MLGVEEEEEEGAVRYPVYVISSHCSAHTVPPSNLTELLMFWVVWQTVRSPEFIVEV
jgi:hypothetical protein